MTKFLRLISVAELTRLLFGVVAPLVLNHCAMRVGSRAGRRDKQLLGLNKRIIR